MIWAAIDFRRNNILIACRVWPSLSSSLLLTGVCSVQFDVYINFGIDRHTRNEYLKHLLLLVLLLPLLPSFSPLSEDEFQSLHFQWNISPLSSLIISLSLNIFSSFRYDAMTRCNVSFIPLIQFSRRTFWIRSHNLPIFLSSMLLLILRSTIYQNLDASHSPVMVQIHPLPNKEKQQHLLDKNILFPALHFPLIPICIYDENTTSMKHRILLFSIWITFWETIWLVCRFNKYYYYVVAKK